MRGGDKEEDEVLGGCGKVSRRTRGTRGKAAATKRTRGGADAAK